MTLSVIGAGVGRTGTLSLKFALERLGFGPCYHMKELLDHLDDHVPLWDRAAQGREIDWDGLLKGYRSAVDFPVAGFYRDLAARYPEAKVVLTLRDPERWFRSYSATILDGLTRPAPDKLAAWGEMVRKTIVERVFIGNASDKAHVIDCYHRHNDEVQRTIPRERLLVYEVSQGWKPLCDFLEVDIPDEPFPKANTTDEFKERFASRIQ
jgi:Sulfotransferase domain